MPGIITGVILAIGRVIGETAAFLLTLGGSILPPVPFLNLPDLAMHNISYGHGGWSLRYGLWSSRILLITILILNLATHGILKSFPGASS